MYAYNRFWLRFANQPFSLDRLDVYEKHFTVMNYSDAELQQMFCQDFVRLFEEQNPGILWEEVRSPSATTSSSSSSPRWRSQSSSCCGACSRAPRPCRRPRASRPARRWPGCMLAYNMLLL